MSVSATTRRHYGCLLCWSGVWSLHWQTFDCSGKCTTMIRGTNKRTLHVIKFRLIFCPRLTQDLNNLTNAAWQLVRPRLLLTLISLFTVLVHFLPSLFLLSLSFPCDTELQNLCERRDPGRPPVYLSFVNVSVHGGSSEQMFEAGNCCGE